jgi:putative membrane protein
MRRVFLVAGAAALALAWFGPLPALAARSFAAHMTLHMAVVAVAAPCLALAMAGTRADPVRAIPRLLAPIQVSMIEFVVVWGWHAPALHLAARHAAWALVLEQASFLAAGFLLWIAACGGDHAERRVRAGAGVVALLFTSMHMTLLGALFALASRPLFLHGPDAASSLADQHLGGTIMLLVGGTSYLLGGLWLTAGLLDTGRPRSAPTSGRARSAPAPIAREEPS